MPQLEDTDTVVSRLEESLSDGNPEMADTGEGQKQYRHLIEMSPTPITVFEESGKSIWCNDALLDVLGIESREELILRSIVEVIHPNDHELARREVESVIEEKEWTGPTQMILRPSIHTGPARSVIDSCNPPPQDHSAVDSRNPAIASVTSRDCSMKTK